MKRYEFKELITPGKTDSISGRDFGITYSQRINLLETMNNQEEIEFVIDDTFVKAINDSFIKGLFNKVFEKYKKVDIVQKSIKIIGNDHFKNLFLKNWQILENIYNA